MRHPALILNSLLLCAFSGAMIESARGDAVAKPAALQHFIEASCLDCHDSETAEGGFDLESLSFDLTRREFFDRWVLIHDRVRDGEMPPPDDGVAVRVVPIGWSSRANVSSKRREDSLSDRQRMLRELAALLIQTDQQRIASAGRAKVRRLNRFEYENTLREVLDAPWLHVADMLPEDGIDHLFNKTGERLDVSHVQMRSYLKTAELAVRLATAAAHPSQKRKFYAREEPVMQHYVHWRFGQRSATRAIVPLLGTTPEPEIIRKKQPVTVGDANPKKRELEAMGVFSGAYGATTKYDFTRINVPTDGQYRLRIKTYTFMAGPNGASGGNDHGLTGGNRKWWRPDRNVAFAGKRSEPITLYALAPSGDSRWLTTFDSCPKPSVFECVVALKKGEGIRPDATRLVRTRPGWGGNPNATQEGVPGFALNWLEVEGPLHETWPPASYQAVFGDLPFVVIDGEVKLISENPNQDARRLLTAFYDRAIVGDHSAEKTAEPFIKIFETATSLEQDFTDAMISAVSAILCSPDFLYLDARPGLLSEQAFAQRLAYFLWNGPHGAASLRDAEPSLGETQLRETVDRMLDDPRSNRFIHAFLDYWLDLRDINANAPDAELYPDYYLDELLTESSVRETRMFFRELIDKNLPVRNLVDADFAFVNERLAEHYGLPVFEGVEPHRVKLPKDSPRGGLLTQASVLPKV